MPEPKKQKLADVIAERDQLAEALKLDERKPRPQPIQVKKQGGRKRESTAFMLASDWHVEETVRPETIDGQNEFNLKIASQRARAFFSNGLSLIETQRQTTVVKTLVLPLMGDFISGHIHPELVENTSLSPAHAAEFAMDLIVSGIEFLDSTGGFKQIVIPCVDGNHARTTEKPRISTRVNHSFEWIMYRSIARHFAGRKNKAAIEVRVPEGDKQFVDVYGRRIRIHHGDCIKYGGGVGGVDVPLKRRIGQWASGAAKPVYCDLLGHWHQLVFGTNYVINGSLIGHNAYSDRFAPFSRPSQGFFLLHEEYGMTMRAPIFLEKAA